MKIIATFKEVAQIGPSEWDEALVSKDFDEDATVSDIVDFYNSSKNTNKGQLHLTILDEKEAE